MNGFSRPTQIFNGTIIHLLELKIAGGYHVEPDMLEEYI